MIRSLTKCAVTALCVNIAMPADADCSPAWIPTRGVYRFQHPLHQVYTVVGLDDGDVLVAGTFSVGGSVQSENIVRYRPRTNSWHSIQPGLNSDVYAMALYPGGDVIVAGRFQNLTTNPMNMSNIARFSPATNTWTSLAGGTLHEVYALAVAHDGSVIVGGGSPLLAQDGTFINSVARFDPASNAWTSLGFSLPNQFWTGHVYAIAIMPNDDIVVAGSTRGPSNGGPGVHRFNGTSWSPLGGEGGSNGDVYALLALPNGDLLAAGGFGLMGGVAAGNIARYRASSNAWEIIGDVSGVVRSLRLLADGTVLVGGEFAAAGGGPAHGVARFNPSTNAWVALVTPPQGVFGGARAVTELPNGDLIFGGAGELEFGYFGFSRYSYGRPLAQLSLGSHVACPGGVSTFQVEGTGGGPLSYVWQVKAETGEWQSVTDVPMPLLCGNGSSVVATPANSAVTNIRVLPCSLGLLAPQSIAVRCLVSNPCGTTASRETTYTVCPADFNCTGDVTVQDIFDFLAAWFAAAPAADFNGVNGVTVQDIFDFLAAWFQGC